MENFELKKIINKILDFQKQIFDTAFDTAVKNQKQAEKMRQEIFKDQSIIPEGGMKLMNEFKDSFKKYQSELK